MAALSCKNTSVIISRRSSIFWNAIYFHALYPSKKCSRFACLPDLTRNHTTFCGPVPLCYELCPSKTFSRLARLSPRRVLCQMVILHCVLYQMLTDKNKQYRSRLEQEDNTKRHQLKILQKTHRTQQEEKQELIENLEALIEDLEEKVAQCEANGEIIRCC